MVLLVFSVFALANTTVSHATSSDEVTEASGTNRFVVWQDNTPGNYEIFFRRSVDDGATWQATKNLSNNPGPSANPEIAVYGSNVYVVWLQQNADNTLSDIFFRRSTDNGATWKPFVKLTSIGNVGGSTPQVINSGSIYVVWDQQNGEIYFRRSTDNGATWKPIFNLSSNPGDSRDEQIGVSGSNAYVVWKQVSDDGTRSDLFFRRSTDNGATWKAKVNLSLSQSGQFTSSPQMAVSGSNVHVVWSQFDSFGSIQVFARSSADNGAVWKSADSLASYSGQASNTRVRVGAAGSNVYVLHAQVEGEDPKAPAIFDIVIVASRDNGNTWEAGFTVPTASAFVIDPDPQILALGSKVYVIWRFGTDGDVGLAFRRSIDNGVTWGPESGDLSNGPRITKVQIDATGSSIFVVWGKPFFSEVFLLRSANSGSTWQSVKNLSNNSGFSASLQIGL
jgi:BNR repeat protein